MGFGLFKSKDKSISSNTSNYSTKTTGNAVARACPGGSGTYAEKGGRAAAVSRHGSAWSQSIAYGGDSDDDKHNSRQVSSKEIHVFTSGNATVGVTKGGTFAHAGKGGYAEAVCRDGNKFSASVAYGGDKKGNAIQSHHSQVIPWRQSSSQRGRIKPNYYSSDEGEDSDG